KTHKSERVLAVGNPGFNTQEFHVERLPEEEKEVQGIAGCYPGAVQPLVEGDATKERVKQEMELANVIHLASHYIVDENSPMLSKLLLAPGLHSSADGKEAAGVLEAREIYGMHLASARLVVLSACQTGVERYYRGEGMIGMSRTFLAKRVPLVVASLWPADSEATALLMVNFHQYRAQGQSTVNALQQAQLDMLRNSPDNHYHQPYYWAAFMLIGGDAPF
ncbi:MAG TPA: CHAT domain-containing protein, partial [Blastocatellia bacterium]|nr:CHAT domain-containing protein [Blastocatellia bacterium]